VSWPLYAAGAALAWNASSLDDAALIKVLNRDIYEDASAKIGGAAMRLGFAHQKLGATAINETALGTVIAAPRPEDRELFCRNGLKWFSKIPRKNILAALKEIEKERAEIRDASSKLRRSRGNEAQTKKKSETPYVVSYNEDSALLFAVELDLAARMAEQSCKYMLWQQAIAAGKTAETKVLAREGIRELRQLDKDYNGFWPLRNKGTTKHSSPYFKWRIEEYSNSK
jgi:hypothetical protein